ncbi:MAG: MBL fold metallo-hydrolase [Methylophilaceae bacterium]
MLEGVGGFAGGNVALSVGDDGVVMIDDAMPPTLGIMQAAIKSITDKPVDFLINTHFHADHAGNNKTMRELGARIFAHENTRERLMAELGHSEKNALPVFTFSHQMNFYLNDNDTYIFHAKNAHTDGDIIVYFKNLNVIHVGDVFLNGMFPFIDLESGGSIIGLIAAQHRILSITDANTNIIPGHGPLAKLADLKASVTMLEDSKKLIKALIIDNKSEDEVVEINPLSKYQQWSREFINTERMTRQVYQSLVSQRK